MTNTWVLVANASCAKIYKTPRAKLFNGNKHLELIEQLEHPNSRKKSGELISEISGHNNFLYSAEPKEQERDKFAKELASILDYGRMNQSYEDLIVVAPPHFSGLLNKHLNSNTDHLISSRIEKDYTRLGEKNLGELLATQIC